MMKPNNSRSFFVYYAGWGMQCCGEPIRIGDEFEEEVARLDESDYLKARLGADYYYDNHSNVPFSMDKLLTISGTVKSIRAIWGSNDEETKMTSIDYADGSEDIAPEGESFLNGYLIELV